MNKTLGLVEVKGLALAIQTVDLMSKSANVEILGLENTNGFGWTLIKVSGDVGSVNAAVEVGVHNAKNQNGLVSHKVIARMSEGLNVGLMEACSMSAKQVTEKSEAISNSIEEKVQVKVESIKPAQTKPSEKNTPETKTIAKTTSTRKATAKKAPPEKGGEA